MFGYAKQSLDQNVGFANAGLSSDTAMSFSPFPALSPLFSQAGQWASTNPSLIPAFLDATRSILDGYSEALGQLSDAVSDLVGGHHPEAPLEPEQPDEPGTPEAPDDALAQNVIFMVPDGFSSAYADGYRFFKGGNEAPVWDELLQGVVQTDSASSPVTDSAASATAYATGEKTYNGAIGVDAQGSPLTSVLDLASDAGKATGIVSTAAITDATPAAFAASNIDRGNQDQIAQEYIDNNDLDVILGGGRAQFLTEAQGGARTDGVDLAARAQAQGFDYASSAEEMRDADGDRLLGLFTDEDMSAPIGNGDFGERPDGEPTLAEMTQAALDRLSQDEEGFFAVIEEEGTDTWGHQNDAATVMNSAASFEDAMQVALDFSEQNPDTLVVSVGDHDTGGLAVEASNSADPSVFRRFDASVEQMESEFDVEDAGSVRATVAEHTGLALDDEQVARIQSVDDDDGLARVLSEEGGIDWTTYGHTGVDVQLYAAGAQSDRFGGVMDNTEIATKVAAAMGLTLPNGQGDAMPADVMGVNDTVSMSELAVA